MPMTIIKELRFEAAHHLPHTPEGHKCRRMHGHSFRCEIHVTGPVDPTTGWVCDFAELTAAFDPLMAQLDHNVLNDIPGLENATSENLSVFIWRALAEALPGLSAVVVHETCAARCVYTGPDSPTPA